MKAAIVNNRKAALLLAILMIAVCVCSVKMAFASTEATHEIRYTFDQQMLVGDSDESLHVISFYSITTNVRDYDNLWVKPDTFEVSSLTPDVLKAEILPNGSNYKIAITAVGEGEGTVRIEVPEKSIIADVNIKVLGQKDAYIENFPSDKEMKTGETFTFNSSYTVKWGTSAYKDYIDAGEDFTVTSSNPDAVEVVKSGSTYYMHAVGTGDAVISINVIKTGNLLGMTRTFNVSVVEGPLDEAKYTLDNFKDTMIAGMSETYHNLYFILKDSEGSSSSSVEVNENNLIVTSLTPDIISAEVVAPYEHDPDYYMLQVKGVSPGTGKIRIVQPRTSGALIAEAEVEVLSNDCVVIEGFSTEKKNLKRGGTFFFKNKYHVSTEGIYGEDINPYTDTTVTSSNPAVVQVMTSDSYSPVYYIKALKPGTATVTMTINKEGPLKGVTSSFDVKVTIDPKATAPVLFKQLGHGSIMSYNSVVLHYKLKNQNAVYEVWRSKSPNKNFKKVATIKVEKEVWSDKLFHVPQYPTGFEAGDKIAYNANCPNANTKYYYKMRVKYTDPNFDHSWSKWSNVQHYWTAPKPIKDKAVKLNKKTRKITIPKQKKKVTGYIYTVSASKFRGYNIFGQKVYYGAYSTRITTKRIFTTAKVEGMNPKHVYDVIPYVKHGKYYYLDGEKPVMKISKFKDHGGHAFVN